MDETILNPPLAPMRGLVSARTMNLLTRNGFISVSDVQQAHDFGTLGGIKGLGTAALLEIKLALGNLPPDAPQLPRHDSPAPPAGNVSALSERELTLLLAMAEAGLDHLDQRVSVSEALTALRHLRQLAGEDEIGDLYPDGPDNDPFPPEPKHLTVDAEGGRTTLKDATTGIPLPRSLSRGEADWDTPARTAPEPEDDEYAGYVIEPKPGWGRF